MSVPPYGGPPFEHHAAPSYGSSPFGDGTQPQVYRCAICASTDGTIVRSFTKTYTPWWVYLTIVIGLLPAAILALVVQTKHRLTAPFCSRCSTRQKLAPFVSIGSLLLAVIALFGGLIVGLATHSWVVGCFGVAIAVVTAVLAGRFDRSANPKYVKVDSKNVIVDDPTYGHVVLVAPPSGQY